MKTGDALTSLAVFITLWHASGLSWWLFGIYVIVGYLVNWYTE